MTEKDNIDENLRKLLEKSDSSAPFRVPDNYFEAFPGQMDKIISQLPDFEKSPAVNPFSVPDGYFEQLPLQINEAILASDKKTRSWKEILIAALRPSISIPSVLTVSLAITAFFFFTKIHRIDVPAYSEISNEEFNSSTIALEVDESTLIQVLTDENIETSSIEDSYEEYLLDNNIDITQLEKKL
ncbi:MAG: hypothetical protein IPP51_08655 [Bacteroidetes bacterium]|nr:hypothetical protein [Bacteroidota bacterium]